MTETFANLGVSPRVVETLTALGLTKPTPIQSQAIPIAMQGKDVMGIAQTGTGKTLAFALPMLQNIGKSKKRGLVVVPTRELALQVDETMQKVGRKFGLRTVVLIGGAAMGPQIAAIKRLPHVIVATPGRLNDHLEQKRISLSDVGVVVLDEADRMLDMGFAPQISRIMAHVPKQRQTMLFSATMPQSITKMAMQYLELPIRVEIVPAGTTPTKIQQEIVFVSQTHKVSLLKHLLKEYKGTTLVFVRTKFAAKRLTNQLRDHNITAAEIHSNRSLAQRQQALAGFKSGKYRVLVATDIAARGIDVTNIALVINFDLPDNPDDYVHRIGRTGRAEAVGHAISFASAVQGRDVQIIERLIRTKLGVRKLPDDLPQEPIPDTTNMAPSRSRFGGGRSRSGGGRSGGFRGGRGGSGGGHRSGGSSRSGGGGFARRRSSSY